MNSKGTLSYYPQALLFKFPSNQVFKDYGSKIEQTELLDQEEKKRFQKILLKDKKNQFLLSRLASKHILGHILNLPAKDILFSYHKNGKPFLLNQQSIHFNISHAQDYLLLFVSSHSPVGVDIEQSKPIDKLLKLASRFCSKNEIQQIISLNPQEQARILLEKWTIKEAVSKNIGLGLRIDFKKIEVPTTNNHRFNFNYGKNNFHIFKKWIQPNYCTAFVQQASSQQKNFSIKSIRIDQDLFNSKLIVDIIN
jgi:phosphopantetheine--protein transferase-like protein